MADLTAVYAALRQAHAAGDTKGATRLAQYIREVSAGGTAVAEEPPETTVGGNIKELFKGLVPGAVNLVESAAVGASALLPEETEKAAREKIKSVADTARAPFAAAPGYEDTIPRKLSEALGSTVPFLLAGPFGLAGRVAATALGVGAGAGEARVRAERDGATDEQRSTATALGTIPGAFEVFAPFRILSRIPTASKSAGVELVKRAFIAGGEEAAQEAASGFAQNLIAQGIYKPEQELIEGLGEQAAYGGATGAIVQGLLDLAIGRRSASTSAPGTPTDTEQKAQEARLRKEQLKLEQGLGEEAKNAQAQGYVGQQGQLFRGLDKPTQPQRTLPTGTDTEGQILDPAADDAALRPSAVDEGKPVTTAAAQKAGVALTPEELEAAGQQQLGLDQVQDTSFFEQELVDLNSEYAALQEKKDKTSADNKRMKDIRTRRTQVTETIRERTADRGPQLRQGQDQGELFTPAELRKGERSFTPITVPSQSPARAQDVSTQEQSDLMLEATFEYADLVKVREQLKATARTPEVQKDPRELATIQARIKYLDGQIRDYTLAGVDQAYQQRVERETGEKAVAEQQAREAVLAEQSAFSQPEGLPVPEPTVRVKPTPETAPTLMSPDVLGTLGIGHSALLRKPSHPIHGLDIAKPEDAAEVQKMLTVYKEGKSAPIVQKVDAYLGRPEFQGVLDVPATTAAQPAPEVSDQPGGRERGVEVSVPPATSELAEPGAGVASTTAESAAPDGLGLVPAGPDAGAGDARVSDAQPAVTDPLAKYEGLTGATRAGAIRGEIGLNNKVIAKAREQNKTDIVDQLTQENARLEKLLPEAETRDNKERRTHIDRQILGQSKSELNTAVANKEMTQAEADALVEEARQTGEVSAAAEQILEGVDKKERGKLTLAKARDTSEDLNIDPETTKAKVKAFAARLYKAGLIDEPSNNAVVDISKDKDMGPEDLLDEIRLALDDYERQQGSTAPTKQPKLTNEPITIDVEAREIPDNQVELLQGPVDRLQADQVAELEDFYNAKKDSPEFFAKLSKDVAKFATEGAKSVAKAIREIIRQIHAGVLAVGIIFNPNIVAPNFPINLPKVFQETVQVTKAVPEAAKGQMSPLAQSVYEAMAPVAMKSGKWFMIADKPNGMLHIFKGDGSHALSDPTLYGKDTGDVLGAVSSLEGGPKVTPAGKFTLEAADSTYAGGKMLLMVESKDYSGYVAIHAAATTGVGENRLQRLETPTAADNKISYGCINTKHDTFIKKILPNIDKLDGGMVFILPDAQEQTAKMFAPETRTETRTEGGKDAKIINANKLVGKEEKAPESKQRASQATPNAEGQTLDSLQAEVAQMPGLLGAALRRMVKSGKVKLETADPEGRKLAGKYDGRSVKLFAQGIPSDSALAVALHEVGAHLGLKGLVGAKQYDAIIKRLISMVEKGDGSVEAKMARAAYKRIPIRDIKRGPEVFGDELLAYFVESMAISEAAGTLPKVGALRNLYNQIKTGILTAVNRVFGTSLGINDLSAAQIQMLAKAAFTKESFTAAKGEATTESERMSVPGTAELNPEDRAAIQALQAELPVEERGSKGVIGQTMQGIKSARENSSLLTILRQQTVDKFATVEAKVSRMFSKGFEDSYGNKSPIPGMRQAEDSHKIVTNFFREGGIRVDKNGLVETFAQGKAVVSAFTKTNDFAKANGMTYAEAKSEVSTVLEGHRLHGIRKYNKELEQSAIILAGKGKTKEAKEERDRKKELHMTYAKIDQMEAIYQKSKGIQGIQADLNATRTQVIDFMVATGRITKEQGQFWKANEDYVPFDRVFEDEPTTPKFIRGKGLAALDSYPGLKGSLGRPVHNVLDSYAGRLSNMVEDAMRNNASVKLLETMELGGFATEVSKPATAKNKDLVLTLYRDGKPVHFEVQNKYDMLAFMQAPEVTNLFTKFGGQVADVLRTTITAMPPFAVKQVIDDMQRAAFYSGVERPLVVAMKTLYNFPKVLFGELTGRNLPGVVRLGQLGVYGEYDYNIYKPVDKIEKELGFVKRNPAGKFLNALEKITKASDLAARLAVYEETMRESGGNEALAATRARELINFSRRGADPTMRVLTRVIPFFNAYAQGTDVLYRAATGRDGASSGERIAARNLFLSRMAIMTGLGFAYAFAMSDDEDYKNATDEVRDNNWLFPGAFKSPVPKEIGFLFKSIPERIVENIRRNGTAEEQTIVDMLGSIVKGAGNAYLFSTPLPTLLKPIVENMTNYSFFLGRELESPSLQRKKEGFRYESSTSELAKAVGEATNFSPIKIDNFLRGIFGLAGSTTLMMTDALLNPARADRPIHQLPFASIFLYDPVGGRNKAEFYKLREKVGQADATFKDLLKTDPAKAEKFLESNEALISAAPMINNTLRDLSQMRSLRTMIEQGTDEMLGMTGKERRELIDEIRGSENELVSYTRELEKMLRE